MAAAGGGSPAAPQRTGGVWANNETLGLPAGLNASPLGAQDLFDLLAGCGAGILPSAQGFTSQRPTGNPCATLVLAVETVGLAATLAVEMPKVHGETLDCVIAKPDIKPWIGLCFYECSKESATDLVEIAAQIPLYRIQSACPPKRPTCPISLQAKFLSVSFSGYEGDIVAHVVPNSCRYTSIP